MAQTINIDLRLTLAQRNAIRNALTTLEAMTASAKFKKLVTYWDQMDEATRQRILDRAPLAARLVALARQLERLL